LAQTTWPEGPTRTLISATVLMPSSLMSQSMCGIFELKGTHSTANRRCLLTCIVPDPFFQFSADTNCSGEIGERFRA
jgi:hypothetical protein